MCVSRLDTADFKKKVNNQTNNDYKHKHDKKVSFFNHIDVRVHFKNKHLGCVLKDRLNGAKYLGLVFTNLGVKRVNEGVNVPLAVIVLRRIV